MTNKNTHEKMKIQSRFAVVEEVSRSESDTQNLEYFD